MSSCWGVILFSSLFVYSVFFYFFALLHDVRIQSFRLWQFNFNYGEIPHNTQQLANDAKKINNTRSSFASDVSIVSQTPLLVFFGDIG